MTINKIAYFLNSFPNVSETFIVYQIIQTIKKKYEVEIYVNSMLDVDDSSQSDLIKKYSLHTLCFKSSIYSGELRKDLYSFLRLLKKNRLDFLKTYFTCLKADNFGLNGLGLYHFLNYGNLLGGALDLCHAHFGPNGRELLKAKRLGFKVGKILTTFHGYDVALTHLSEYERGKYYEELFRVGDLFTVNTPYLRDEILSLGCPQNRLKVIPMGIDIHHFSPKTKTVARNKIRLLSVGRLIPFKSFELGILSVKTLLDRGYDIKYTIIGDGESRADLEKMAAKLKIKDSVVFTGSLDQTQVLNYMQNSDIFLMTSTFDEFGRRETQGVVVGEAQACGLPVCAFRSGGVPYAMKEGETGLLAEEKNLEQYTENLKYIIDHDEIRKAMGLSARKFVIENYSLEKTSGKFIKLYEDLL
jgi:colanic acid/amylovoran biosynthesis glycosyltransferase